MTEIPFSPGLGPKLNQPTVSAVVGACIAPLLVKPNSSMFASIFNFGINNLTGTDAFLSKTCLVLSPKLSFSLPVFGKAEGADAGVEVPKTRNFTVAVEELLAKSESVLPEITQKLLLSLKPEKPLVA